MDYASAIEPVSMLKSRASKLIQIARVTRRPVVITQNGRAAAVLVDADSYDQERRTLQLLQYLAAGEGELRGGRGVPQEQARRQLARAAKGGARG